MKFKKLPPPAKSNKQVQEYVDAIERGRRNYYVIQNGSGWYVRKASVRNRSGELFNSKSEAVRTAQARADRNKSRVLVFNNKGTLISR